MDNYCADCKRSMHGEYHDCDMNIENGGNEVKNHCYCKVDANGERAERYPWEEKNDKN